MTVVMATHDMPQGQRLAKRIGVVLGGTIQQTGSPGDIFSSPETEEVARFVGVENILEGTIREKEESLATIEVNGKSIQAFSENGVGEPVYVLVRPEHTTLSLARDPTSARNVFEGKIKRLTPLGPQIRIEIDCGFPLFSIVTGRSAEDLGLSVGATVYVSFKATATHTIKRFTTGS